MAGEKQIHAGHRQRMHERVQKYGLESLAEHEMLEYLLYFTITRRDTNPIAHALLERFGDFAGVLEADEEELCLVETPSRVMPMVVSTVPITTGGKNRRILAKYGATRKVNSPATMIEP